jgi:hypothetical protein
MTAFQDLRLSDSQAMICSSTITLQGDLLQQDGRLDVCISSGRPDNGFASTRG